MCRCVSGGVLVCSKLVELRQSDDRLLFDDFLMLGNDLASLLDGAAIGGLHHICEILCDVAAHLLDDLTAFAGDAYKNLAAISCCCAAGNVVELLELVHHACCGSCGVSHHLGDIAHGETFFLCKVSEEEKLRVGKASLAQFWGKSEHAAALRKDDKISEFLRVFAGH